MMSLGAAATRGAGKTLAGQGLRFILQFAGTLTLAHLLVPGDFGLLVMVTAIVGIGEIIRDFGLSSAALQAVDITQDEKSNLFWVNTAIGVVLAAAVVAGSPLIAFLYGDPRLQDLSIPVAATFVLNGFQTQFQAELAAKLRFGALAVSEVLATAASVTVGVALAWYGVGYWALAAQLVVLSTGRALMRTALARWWPGRYKRAVPVKRFFRFASGLVGTQLLVYVSSNIDNVMLGLRNPARVVGLYSQAYQLVMTPNTQVFPPLTQVALPVLARVQGDQVRFDYYVKRAQAGLGYALVAVFAVGFATADPLVRLLLGTQWAGSAPYFRILAVAAAFQSITYIAYWVFLSRGLTSSNFRYALVVRSVLVCAVVAASFVGPRAVALAYMSGLVAAWPFSLWWLSRVTDVDARGLFLSGCRMILVGSSAAAVGSIAVGLVEASYAASVFIGTGLVASVFLLSAFLIPGVRRDAHDIRRTVLVLRRPRVVEAVTP